MVDLAGGASARPSVEISQCLSHIIGGFPGVLLPTLRLIYVAFLKRSYVHRAMSRPSPGLSIEEDGCLLMSCLDHPLAAQRLSLCPALLSPQV